MSGAADEQLDGSARRHRAGSRKFGSRERRGVNDRVPAVVSTAEKKLD